MSSKGKGNIFPKKCFRKIKIILSKKISLISKRI